MDQFVKLRHGNVTYTGKSKLVQFYVLNVTAGINNQSQLQFNILLQRMYFYHLAATYLPTICLLIIAELTLYIDESHFDTTIMVSLTSMLVMYTLYQSIAASLPQTAYLKMIDIWLLFGLMTPFVVFLFEVFFQLLKQRLESGSQHANLLRWRAQEHYSTQLAHRTHCILPAGASTPRATLASSSLRTFARPS